MAMTRAPAPDFVTLASLHAALDGVVELEALFADIHVPLRALPAAQRLHVLAGEMRELLVGLLRPEPNGQAYLPVRR